MTPFLDPDWDGDDDSSNPLFANGIYFKMGYFDYISGVRIKRSIPSKYQFYYDDGWNFGVNEVNQKSQM